VVFEQKDILPGEVAAEQKVRHLRTGGGFILGASYVSASVNEHGNDFVFYSAVEPDSLIAVPWHFSACLSSGCL